MSQRKGNRYYAVVYEGLDPITGKEIRKWHAAGTCRGEAETLARKLAAEIDGASDATRSLTFGAYLTRQWLPGKANTLAESTWHGYRRKIERHVLPTLGAVPIARLKVTHLDGLYDSKLRPADADTKALAPKTVLEIHLIIRGALDHAANRGIVKRNVALVAHAPRLRSIPKHESQAWTASQLAAFLRAAIGHRLFPAFWLAANTGMRRSELLGLKSGDVDLDKNTVSANRGLVAVGYELHESRGKTANSRRSVDLDSPTVDVLNAWRQWTRLEQTVTGKHNDYVFTPGSGQPVHPHSISQAFERISRRAGLPVIWFHDLRHTHATLFQRRSACQSRLGEARARHDCVHDRDLPTRHARHASRSSVPVRSAHRLFYRRRPVDASVEVSPERKKSWPAPRLTRTFGGGGRIWTCDLRVMSESVRKLATFQFETAVFGHGSPVDAGASAQVAALAESL